MEQLRLNVRRLKKNISIPFGYVGAYRSLDKAIDCITGSKVGEELLSNLKSVPILTVRLFNHRSEAVNDGGKKITISFLHLIREKTEVVAATLLHELQHSYQTEKGVYCLGKGMSVEQAVHLELLTEAEARATETAFVLEKDIQGKSYTAQRIKVYQRAFQDYKKANPFDTTFKGFRAQLIMDYLYIREKRQERDWGDTYTWDAFVKTAAYLHFSPTGLSLEGNDAAHKKRVQKLMSFYRPFANILDFCQTALPYTISTMGFETVVQKYVKLKKVSSRKKPWHKSKFLQHTRG